jgi:sialate O-acetylesterase
MPNMCQFVDGRIDGNRVLLKFVQSSPPATRVRFCWADSPVCTLYDEARLPAGPFEIEIDR